MYPNVLLPRLLSTAFHAVWPRLRPNGYHGRLAAAIRERRGLEWEQPDKIWQRQRVKWNTLLAHAAKNVPYYRRLAETGYLQDRIDNPEDIRCIPVLTKDIIRREGDALLAEDFPRSLMHRNATGGSTGMPLHFWSDEPALLLGNAGEAWSSTVAGLDARSSVARYWGAGRFEPSFVRDWRDKFQHMLQNCLFINCFKMSEDDLYRTHRLLHRFSPDGILGYASALVEFARFLQRDNIRPDYPRLAVISAAETLDPASRDILEATFGPRVFNRYGSREIGLIAMECDRHQGLHIDCENVFAEMIDDDATGLQRIIVTKLNQFGMPFLRYDIEDLAEGPIGLCSCGRGYPVLKRIVGRVTETIRMPDGGCLPGEIFPHLMKDCGIAAYRVVQNADYALDVALVRESNQTHQQDEHLRRVVAEHVGRKVPVAFRYVDHIERSATGKLLPVVSHAPAAASRASEEPA
jgi:phenylacetate-CoA ligase